MAITINNGNVSIDTQDTATAELRAAFLSAFGSGPDGIDTTPTNYTGREIQIWANREVLVQQLVVELITLLNLDDAQGRFLDFIGTLLRAARLAATAATIPATLGGTPGANIGDLRVKYNRNGTIWRVPQGTVVGANGFVSILNLTADTKGTNLNDGTQIIAFADATTQWTIIDTNGNSFTSCASTGTYSPGTNVEDDEPYRERLRVAGLSATGVATEPGVLKALQAVAGSTARIDNNRGITPNANGVPGKSIEALVEQGDPVAIGNVLVAAYGASDGFFGNTEVTVQNPVDGTDVVVEYTVIERIDVLWLFTIDVTGAETPLPENPENVVQTAVAAYTNALPIEIDVQPGEASASIRNAFAPGTIPDGNITAQVALKSGGAFGPSPIVITSRQRARTNAEPQPAEVAGAETETFNVVNGQILQLSADNGSAQDVTFTVTDFATISAASAAEVAQAINDRTTGIEALSVDGALVLRSATSGATSQIDILGGSTPALLTTLGLGFGSTFGSDSDIGVTFIGA